MSKSIAIFNLGAHGHVNPTLAVTRDLVTRGFSVTYFCTESMGVEIRLTGAQFEPYESQFTAPQQPAPGGKFDVSETPTRLIHEALAVIPQLIEKTRALNPDLIIFDSMCLAGRLIGQRLGIDAIRFSPSYAANQHWSVMMSAGPQGFAPTPDSMARFQAAAHLLASTYGLPALGIRDVFGYAADLNIVFLPREFQPFGETFDERFVFVGPCLGPRSAHSGFSVPATEPGEKLLFISLGTVFNQWPEFFEMCFEAFASQPVKVIASVGFQMDIKSFKHVPDNFFLYAHVPQLEVLQKADVFITHAGMNGAMEAVCAGVPMIAIPQMIEQAATAKRIQELGIGIALTRETTTAASLRDGFEKIIHDKGYQQQARKMGAYAAAAGGAKKAANVICERLKVQP